MRSQLQGVGGDDGAQQGGRRRHDDDGPAAGQSSDGFDAQAADFLGGRAPVVQIHVPGGKIAHHRFAGDRLEIVAPLLGAVFVGGHDEQWPGHRSLDVGEEEGGQSGG